MTPALLLALAGPRHSALRSHSVLLITYRPATLALAHRTVTPDKGRITDRKDAA